LKRSLSSRNEPQQRLVIKFSRGEQLKYIAHLDMMRLWHRAMRRAGMPLAYSQGYNPQPRIAIAAPLAVGVTSEGELMDVFLCRKVSLDFFVRAMMKELPDGIEIKNVKDIWLKLPSLQSRVCFAEYVIRVAKEMSSDEASRSMKSLLQKESVAWQHYRGAKIHKYDLRQLIEDLWVVQEDEESMILGMRLINGQTGAGRPEQVLLALGFEGAPESVHRTSLIMEAN